MKRFALLVICFFITDSAFSQYENSASVKWGPELYRPRKTDISVLIGSDGSSFYCLRTVNSIFASKEYVLEKYSKTKLSLEFVKEIKLPEINRRKMTFEKIVLLNKELMLFTSRYDSEQDRNCAYITRISTSNGSALDQAVEIDQIVSFKKRNKGSFEFIISTDSTKFLVAHNEPFDRYDNEKFSYKLFDSSGESIWSASLELPYRDTYVKVTNYALDETGKVFMLASVTKEKSERERKKPRYTYDLVSYDHASRKLHETPINLGDQFISDISFGITRRGEIAVGGFYSNKSQDGLAGTFNMTIDKKNGEIIRKGSQDLTSDFLKEFMSNRRANKLRELYNYKIDHLISQSDGGLLMVAEQYYVVVVQQCQPRGGCTTSYNYYYNDIIVVSIRPDASVKWIKKIPKLQITSNDFGYLSSYALVIANNKLNFIFNDHPKNLEENRKKMKNGVSRKMVTVLASIDDYGNVTKKALFSAKEQRVHTRPKIALQIAQDQSLFYAIRKKIYKFGIIGF